MRPHSIIYFERVSFAAFLVLLLIYLEDFLRKVAFKSGIGDYTISQLLLLSFNLMLVVIIGVLFFSFPYWLALLVTRRRSRVAKTTYYVLVVLSIISCFGTLLTRGTMNLVSLSFIVETILFLIALYFLIKKSSSDWLSI